MSIMFGKFVKERRLKQGLSVKEMAANLAMDASLLSRIENNKRLPKEAQLKKISEILETSFEELSKLWLEEKLFNTVKQYPQYAGEVLKALETRTEYLSGKSSLDIPSLPSSITQELEEIDELKEQWQERKPKSGVQLDKMSDHFSINYTYESNRIEGNTLTLQETFLVINEGLTIAGKGLQEHLEAINHNEAIYFINELIEDKLDLSAHRLKELHYLILKGIDRKNAGCYRGVDVRISGSRHIPPAPFLLDKMMEDYFIHYENQKRILHPALLAAEMHERLVSIHPFIDGNGRTSRLVMNLILLQHGYTTTIFKGNLEDRLEYYKALETVQVDNDPIPFYLLTLKMAKLSLVEHLKLV